MMNKMINWFPNRLCEPSTWCAIGGAVSIVGLFIGMDWMVYVGLAGAAIAFMLKEKDVF
tara:strand:+ start:271 stop:447 length:177 start_codon:yes stop_codon:yes gene_type:complete